MISRHARGRAPNNTAIGRYRAGAGIDPRAWWLFEPWIGCLVMFAGMLLGLLSFAS